MSSYLIKVTEQYRCDTEAEAQSLIETAKKSNQYTVTKSSSEIKTTKQKGEVIDEWRRVLITKEFNDEKEPGYALIPKYEVEGENDDEQEY